MCIRDSQMIEYTETDSQLAFMDRMEREAREEVERRRRGVRLSLIHIYFKVPSEY